MSRWQTGIIPHQRPLKLFDGNTAHSSGYFYQRAGAIYFGGRLWNEDSDGGKLYYWSGRYELDARCAWRSICKAATLPLGATGTHGIAVDRCHCVYCSASETALAADL